MVNASGQDTPIPAIRIGSTAIQLLSSDRRPGKVLAVVSNCIYMVKPDGQLVWLANQHVPMHSRSIQLDGELPVLVPGLPFQVSGGQLVFPNGLRVSLKDAFIWQPAELAPAELLELHEVQAKTCRVYSDLTGYPPHGFGTFIRPILDLFFLGRATPQPQFSDPILRPAWPAVEEVVRASANQDLSGLLAQVRSLVGFGSGLTPSGDDFLGGLFFGLYTLKLSYPFIFNLDLERIEQELIRMRGHTNLISETMLHDLSRGQGPETIHQFLRSLLLPGNPGLAIRDGRVLASLGHSTGWDLLTGLLAALPWARPAEESDVQVGNLQAENGNLLMV